MDRVEREGLCSDDSVEIFVQWYMFGGASRGLSLTEILEMPSWLRRDFRYMLGQISDKRRDQEAFESMIKQSKGKVKK